MQYSEENPKIKEISGLQHRHQTNLIIFNRTFGETTIDDNNDNNNNCVSGGKWKRQQQQCQQRRYGYKAKFYIETMERKST